MGKNIYILVDFYVKQQPIQVTKEIYLTTKEIRMSDKIVREMNESECK